MKSENDKKPRKIGFRVSDETWELIEREIAGTADSPHDWARKVVLEKLSQEEGFSRTNRLIYEQLASVRYLVGYGFQLLATGELSPKEWELKRTEADQRQMEIAKLLLTRQRVSRQ